MGDVEAKASIYTLADTVTHGRCADRRNGRYFCCHAKQRIDSDTLEQSVRRAGQGTG